MDRVKKGLAYLLSAVLIFAAIASAAPEAKAFGATRNPISELGIQNLPEGNTIEVGDVFNFNPDIIATKLGEGKTTGKVWWEVNVKTNTAGVMSSRWGYVYPVQAGSFEIRALAFENEGDMELWKAARSANGKVADEAATAKYVTAMTDWVKIDVVSDIEGYAVVRSQYRLEKVLKDNQLIDIHIVTDKDVKFTINPKNYTTRTLTVDAPNAEVENAGRFAQINIQQSKESTFTEKAYGNRFYVTAPNAKIVFLNNARTSEVVFEPEKIAETKQITLVGGGGTLSKLDIKLTGNVDIIGNIFADRAGKAVVVNVAEEAAGTSIRTEAALEVNAAADVTVTVDRAEGSEAAQDELKTIINMESSVKVSVDGTAADGTIVVVKDGAKGSEIASDASLVIIAEADVSLNLSDNAAGTTVTKGENVTVELSEESTVEVTVTDVNGTVETIKPGEESPEVTAAPEPTNTPTFEPTSIPTPEPTSTPTPDPTSTPTPDLTSTPTPDPTSTPTPDPTSTPTPDPTSTPTPDPTSTPTPEPTSTPTPDPTSTPTPDPTSTPTPMPTSTPTPTPVVTYTKLDIEIGMVTGSEPWNNDQNCTADKVFDGNINTYFDGLTNGWVCVDLGESCIIGKLRYAPRQNYQYRLDGAFYGSVDGERWYMIYDILTAPSGNGWVETSYEEFTTVAAFRYVKYVADTANIGEIEIYKAEGIPQQLLTELEGVYEDGFVETLDEIPYDLGMVKAKYNTEALDEVSALACDNKPSTVAKPENGGAIVLPLDKGYYVSAIAYMGGSNDETSLTDLIGGEFYGSADGTKWELLYEIKTAPEKVGSVFVYYEDLLVMKKFNYVKYENPNGVTAISEIRVYGVEAGDDVYLYEDDSFEILKETPQTKGLTQAEVNTEVLDEVSALVCDNNPSTIAKAENGKEIVLKLKKGYLVTAIGFMGGNDGDVTPASLRGGEFYGSADGENWDLLYKIETAPQKVQSTFVYSEELLTTNNYNYIKYKNPSGVTAISEIRVYGMENAISISLAALPFATSKDGNVNNIALFWSSSLKEGTYELYRTDPSGNKKLVYTTESGTSWQDYDLAFGEYTYQITLKQGEMFMESKPVTVASGEMPNVELHEVSNQFGGTDLNWGNGPSGYLGQDGKYYRYSLKSEDHRYWVVEEVSDDGYEFSGNRVVLDTSDSEMLENCLLESVGFTYVERLNKVLLAGHWEKAGGYADGKLLLATCTPGDDRFTLHGIFNPEGIEVRDKTLFFDDDGSVYLIAAANKPGQSANASIYVFLFEEDLSGIKEITTVLFENQFREMPNMQKIDGWYYFFTSQTAGWYPSTGSYASSRNIAEGWSDLREIGNTSTFSSQSSWIATIGSENTKRNYLMYAYRWINGAGSSDHMLAPAAFADGAAYYDYFPSILHNMQTGDMIPVSEGKLLSQDCEVTSSLGVAAGSSLSYVTDGNYYTAYSADRSSWPVSLTLDLKETYDLTQLQISWYICKGSEGYYIYDVYGSEDGETWELICRNSDESDTMVSKTYGFNVNTLSGAARYVRIDVKNARLQNNPNYNWYTPTIYEIKVFGNEKNGSAEEKVTYSKIPITNDQVSGSNSSEVANCVDGNLETSYDGGDGGWVKVDLGADYVIGKFRYAPSQGNPEQLNGAFYGSQDGDTWYKIYTIETSPAGNGWLQTKYDKFTVVSTFRYIKYQTKGSAHISEIEIYAAAGIPEEYMTDLSQVEPEDPQLQVAYRKITDGQFTSSSLWHGSLENCTDENLGTYVEGDNGGWVQVDLGKNYVIGKLKYAPRNDFPERLNGTFYGSVDGNTWYEIYKVTAPKENGWQQATYEDFTAISEFRYVRYQTVGLICISELEIYVTEDIPEEMMADLENRKPMITNYTKLVVTRDMITCSYPYGVNDGDEEAAINAAFGCFDGDVKTFFDGNEDGWICVDLGKKYVIGKLGYAPRNENAAWCLERLNGTFFGSVDGENWYEIFKVTPPSTIGLIQTSYEEFKTVGAFRYVKYWGENSANISEIEIYTTDDIQEKWISDIPEAPTPDPEVTYTKIEVTANMVTSSTPWDNGSDVATNCFDGSVDTFFDGTEDGWISVDLGERYVIGKLGYAARTGDSYLQARLDGAFYGSNDGVTWYMIYDVVTPPGNRELVQVTHEKFDVIGEFQYIRYWTAGTANISEIEIYKAEGFSEEDMTDLSNMKPMLTTNKKIEVTKDMITCSYTWGTYNPENEDAAKDEALNCFDGNTSTFFDGVNDGWICVDLGKPCVIGKLRYAPRPGDYYRTLLTGTFYGSVDGENWYEIYTVPQPTRDGWLQTSYEVFITVNAFQYVKYATTGGDGHPASISEIEIYETEGIPEKWLTNLE